MCLLAYVYICMPNHRTRVYSTRACQFSPISSLCDGSLRVKGMFGTRGWSLLWGCLGWLVSSCLVGVGECFSWVFMFGGMWGRCCGCVVGGCGSLFVCVAGSVVLRGCHWRCSQCHNLVRVGKSGLESVREGSPHR